MTDFEFMERFHPYFWAYEQLCGRGPFLAGPFLAGESQTIRQAPYSRAGIDGGLFWYAYDPARETLIAGETLARIAGQGAHGPALRELVELRLAKFGRVDTDSPTVEHAASLAPTRFLASIGPLAIPPPPPFRWSPHWRAQRRIVREQRAAEVRKMTAVTYTRCVLPFPTVRYPGHPALRVAYCKPHRLILSNGTEKQAREWLESRFWVGTLRQP